MADKEIETKFERKPMGNEMVELVESIQKQFIEKFGFSPSIVDITDLIARKIAKAGGVNIN